MEGGGWSVEEDGGPPPGISPLLFTWAGCKRFPRAKLKVEGILVGDSGTRYPVSDDRGIQKRLLTAVSFLAAMSQRRKGFVRILLENT